ncbi:MAG: sodium:proton antiporter NhaD [Schleiferiaceae bacterium]|nr:sodium:proton antiporter NhaD [Schleiferiaceae bacterium]
MIIVFILGYAAIAFEHNLKIDKAAAALVTGVLCWTIYVFGGAEMHLLEHELLEHIGEISSILFFLLGAMTIVEVVDTHGGFNVITDKIATKNKVRALWTVCLLTFFFSSILDNLTTSIVMISLLRKLIKDKQTRWLFAGMVVISANSGGAFSPIGDVTTTMLWIGGQISVYQIISTLFIPSIITLLAPLIYLSWKLEGEIEQPEVIDSKKNQAVSKKEQSTVLAIGVLGLIFVPVFKTLTHLPPFMGMMFSLGILWLVTDVMHRKKSFDIKRKLSVIGVFKKVDVASVLFFLGILLAVSSLQTGGQLDDMALGLDRAFGTDSEAGIYLVGSLIGLLSAIVDNVPLVAGVMGAYELVPGTFFAQDALFWNFLAYCAGTGGSVLIIGSAAGVAVMGLEKIPFGWYLKKISLLALIGYISGILAYVLQAWVISMFNII